MTFKVEKRPAKELHNFEEEEELYLLLMTLIQTPQGLITEPFEDEPETARLVLPVRFGACIREGTIELDIHNLSDDYLMRFSSDINFPTNVKEPVSAFQPAIEHMEKIFPADKITATTCFAAFYAHTVHFEELHFGPMTFFGLGDYGMEVLDTSEAWIKQNGWNI